jgi:hypothetical protein
MSGRISIGFVDLAAVSFEFDRVHRHLARSFLARNWWLPDTLDKPTEWETSSFLELRQREAVPDIAWRNSRLPETPMASFSPRKRMARNESKSAFLSTLLDGLGAFSLRLHRPPTSAHRSIARLCNE